MKNHPMTYLSQKAIFPLLSLETRRKLAVENSNLRKMHQKYSFSLETASFEYGEDVFGWGMFYKITLDGLTWEMRNNRDSEDLKTVTLPSGRRVDVKSDKKISEELVSRFMKYYLGREGTQIQKLRVKDFEFHLSGFKNIIRISELYVEDSYVNLLNYLRGSNLQKFVLKTDHLDSSYDDSILNEMRTQEITTDLLVLKTSNRRVPQITGVAGRVHLLNYYVSEYGFDDVCEQLKRSSEDQFPCGSVYRGLFSDMNEETDGFLEGERQFHNGEYKYNGDRSGVCFEVSSGDRELFLTAFKEKLDERRRAPRLTFQFEMLKKGTTLFFHKLPAALQEKYQALDAEQTRLKQQSENERLEEESQDQSEDSVKAAVPDEPRKNSDPEFAIVALYIAFAFVMLLIALPSFLYEYQKQ